MKHAHYQKDISHLQSIDVYRVCQLFDVTDPCLAHAIKKLLCAGRRGAKTQAQDVQEAIDTLTRYQGMQLEDSSQPQPATQARAEELQADDTEQARLKEFARIHHKIYVLFEPVTKEEALLHAEMIGRQELRSIPYPDNADLIKELRNLGKEVSAMRADGRSHVWPTSGMIFKEEPADDGWINWNGGECPVDKRATVEYRMRDGRTHQKPAGRLAWVHDGFDSEIIAYRVVAA